MEGIKEITGEECVRQATHPRESESSKPIAWILGQVWAVRQLDPTG